MVADSDTKNGVDKRAHSRARAREPYTGQLLDKCAGSDHYSGAMGDEDISTGTVLNKIKVPECFIHKLWSEPAEMEKDARHVC